jgi:hypothetical protein
VDYTLANGTATITAGSTSTNIVLVIAEDALDETNETVIVTLSSSPSNASVGTNTVHTHTITDDDGAPTVAFNAISSNGTEAAGTQNLAVGLSAASGQDVTVYYTVTGGTATTTGAATGVDYTLANGTATITAGSTSTNIVLAIVEDALDETDETVIVTLSNPSNAALGANDVRTHTHTITDNDGTPTVAFDAVSSSATEATGNQDLVVNLSAASGQDVTVYYTVTGTATSGADYTLDNGTATIAAGSTSTNIVLDIVDDALDETNETVIVTLSSPTNAALGTNTVHTHTILIYFSYFSSGDTSTIDRSTLVEDGGRCWYKSGYSSDYGGIFAVTWCSQANNEDPQSFAFDATTGLIHVLQDPSKCVSFNQPLSVTRGPRVITEDCGSPISPNAKTFAREGNVFKWTGSGSTPLVITAVDVGSTNDNWKVYMRPFVSGDQNQVWTSEVHRSP